MRAGNQRDNSAALETRRRSIVKSLTWRVIGVVWTWVGAFVILLLVPDARHRAVWIATLIVVYHHSTRVIMYYFYERIWTSVKWGRTGDADKSPPITVREALIWTLAIAAVVVGIFAAIIYIGPMMKTK